MSKPFTTHPPHATNATLTIVGNGYQISAPKNAPEQISWNRRELDAILRIYGHKVAAAEWRDYAIDALSDRAVFSVFRRASEVPLFRIEKHPKLARKQGAYQVVGANGAILKRGHNLSQVLRLFEKRTLRIID